MATPSKLIIVESPAKARTIAKFLGRGYKVEASQGHVRDMPKSQIGVDVEHGQVVGGDGADQPGPVLPAVGQGDPEAAGMITEDR